MGSETSRAGAVALRAARADDPAAAPRSATARDVGRRTAAAIALLVALLAAMIAVGGYALYSLHESGDRSFVREALPLRARVADLLLQMVNQETGVRAFVVTRREESLAPYRAGHAAADGDLRALGRLVHVDRSLAPLLVRARRLEASLDRYFAHEIALARAGPHGDRQAAAAIERGKRRFDAFRATQEAMRRETDRFVARARADRGSVYQDGRTLIFGLGAVALLIGGWLMARVPRRMHLLVGEREEAETERATIERRHRLILEAAGEGIFALDRDGLTLAVNPAAARILGWDAEGEGVLGSVQHEVSHHSHPDGTPYPRERCPIWKVLHDGRQREVRDEVFWRLDGTAVPVEYVCAPLVDDGEVSGVVVMFRDVTAQRRAEAALRSATATLRRRAISLEQSNAELQQFAYVASHDLSEPLRMITGFAQLIRDRYRGRLDEEADEFIDYLVDGSERMQRLINDLLAYSRVGRSELVRGPVDMSLVVDGAVAAVRARVEETGAEVVVGELPTVEGDATLLGQVVQNLLANALKFTGERVPRVEVSAAREGDAWRVCVTDNGIGIARHHAERIFKMFQRLHTREEYEGTGIGLAICQKIVERHGGRIWAEPAEAGGARFCFTIPDTGPGQEEES